MKKIIVILGIALIMLVIIAILFISSNSFTKISYDEKGNIIYNGNSYSKCEGYHWLPVKDGQRLGTDAQWGIFKVKGSNGAALHVYPPNSEFTELYLRSDIKVPEFTAKNINRIKYIKRNTGFAHIFCNGTTTTDKDVIKEFMDLVQNSEDAKIDPSYGSCEGLYLYSNSMPGCVYPIELYEKDGLHFINYDHKLVIIPEEILNKLDK